MESRKVNLISLDFKTISDYLSKRLQIALNPDCIKTPKAEVVQQVCSSFLRVALDVAENQLTLLPFGVDMELEFDTEMHRRSIPVGIVYQSLKAVLKDITCDQLDLTMCDLVRPWKDPRRIKQIFSFFVDFLKLVDVMRPQFNSVLEEFTEKRAQIEEYQELLINSEERKKTLIDQESTRKRRELDLYNNLKTTQCEFNEVVKNYENFNRLTAEFEKKMNENLEELKRLDLDGENGRKTVEHLSVELLSSPNRVRSDTEKQRQELMDIDSFSVATKEELRKRERALEICAKSEKQIGWLVERSKTLKNEKIRVEENLERVLEKKNGLAELDQEHGFIVNKLKMESGLVTESLQNHEQLRENNSKRLEELEHRLDDGKIQIEKMKNEHAPSSHESKTKMATILSIRNSISEAQRNSDQHIQEVIEKMKKMNRIFEANKLTGVENSQLTERTSNRLRFALNEGEVNRNMIEM